MFTATNYVTFVMYCTGRHCDCWNDSDCSNVHKGFWTQHAICFSKLNRWMQFQNELEYYNIISSQKWSPLVDTCWFHKAKANMELPLFDCVRSGTTASLKSMLRSLDRWEVNGCLNRIWTVCVKDKCQYQFWFSFPPPFFHISGIKARSAVLIKIMCYYYHISNFS